MHLKKCEISDLSGKIIVRVDLNLPETDTSRLFKHPRVVTTTRLISELSANSRVTKIIILSHRGRPVGFNENLSLRPYVGILEQACLCNIMLIPGAVVPSPEMIRNIDSKIILLDNLRFHTGELDNDPIFAETLANLGDIYINNAFSVVHRNHASVVAIAEQMSAYSYAGPALIHEVHMLERLVGDSVRLPFMAILGGAKPEDKLPLALKLIKKTDVVAVGGALAYEGSDALKLINKACDKSGTRLIAPLDYTSNDDGIVLDIGPQTISAICQEIKSSNTVFWNGPVGQFEIPDFARGTIGIADCLEEEFKSRSDLGFSSVIGGGATATAFDERQATFISTGGGATTAFLVKGYGLPGLKQLSID